MLEGLPQLYLALLEAVLALVLLWIPVRDGKMLAAMRSLEERPMGPAEPSGTRRTGTLYTPATGEVRQMRSTRAGAHAGMRLVAVALLLFAFTHLARFLAGIGWI